MKIKKTAMNKSKPTPWPRCKDCKWAHIADSVNPLNNFLGVDLCPLHAAAHDLLQALQEALRELDGLKSYQEDRAGENMGESDAEILAKAAIQKATGGNG